VDATGSISEAGNLEGVRGKPSGPEKKKKKKKLRKGEGGGRKEMGSSSSVFVPATEEVAGSGRGGGAKGAAEKKQKKEMSHDNLKIQNKVTEKGLQGGKVREGTGHGPLPTRQINQGTSGTYRIEKRGWGKQVNRNRKIPQGGGGRVYGF